MLSFVMSMRGAGRYIVGERLGAGGMGEVFRAQDRLGGIVALKRITAREQSRDVTPCNELKSPTGMRRHESARESTEGAFDESFGPRKLDVSTAGMLSGDNELREGRYLISQEFRTLAALRHPHVVEVLDYGFDSAGRPYFTMELLRDAKPITVACADLPFDERVRLLGQLLRAVRYLHSRGLLHRDLKPTNVLVSNGAVKVVDFGIAHVVSMADARASRWGSRGYRAPELAMGVAPSRTADLYALGAIACEMFGGGAPHAEMSERVASIDARIAPLIVALLTEDWRARPQSADAVLSELETATGITLTGDAVAEVDDALRSSPLVGREAELVQLDEGVRRLMLGQGSAWLVHGESGIGKSRLVDELRTRALVAGALVLEGQAIAEGSAPYQLLLEMTEGLVMSVDVTPAERETLIDAMPQLARVLGAEERSTSRKWSDAQDALFRAIEGLLARTGQPVLMILEDLHWAGSEALTTVRWLAERARTLGVMLVATERDERAQAKRDASFNQLPLSRLDPEETQRIADALLGARSDASAQLAQESEGNPLILMALVRGLLLPRDARTPSGSATDALEQMIRGRLQWLTGDDKPLLELSAVIGRVIRPELLQALVPGALVDSWVSRCIAAGVLERRADRIRFVHARIQEAVLSLIASDDRRRLHARVGAALEASVAEPSSAELAHHFSRAGDARRTAMYASLAADRALAASAHAETIAHLNTALAARAPGVDARQRSRWLRLMAVAHSRIGNYPEAFSALTRALDEVGASLPAKPSRRAFAIVGELVRVLVRTLPHGAPEASSELTELALAHVQFAEASFYLDQRNLFLLGLLRAHSLSERGAPSVVTQTYSLAGLLLGTAGLHSLSRMWFARGRVVAESAEWGSKADLATVIHREGAFLVTRARWEESGELLFKAQALATGAGDRRQWQESTTVLGLRDAYRGRYAESVRYLAEVHASATKHADTQGIFWGALRAYSLLRLDNLPEAERVLDEMRARVKSSTSVHDLISLHGFTALTALRNQERDRAANDARLALHLVTNAEMLGYWTYHGLDAATETIAELYATEESEPRRRALLVDFERACKLFLGFRSVCPFAEATALAWEALRLHHRGEARAAARQWRAAKAAQRSLGVADLPTVVKREFGVRS